jgi:hypothetical protein
MMILDVLMMLGNGVDCDAGEVVMMRLRRMVSSGFGVIKVDAGGWTGFEIVAPTGGGMWCRTEVAFLMGMEKKA